MLYFCTFSSFRFEHRTHEEQILEKYPQSCSIANMMRITFETCSLIIQGVSWLVDITAGGDFLGLCD